MRFGCGPQALRSCLCGGKGDGKVSGYPPPGAMSPLPCLALPCTALLCALLACALSRLPIRFATLLVAGPNMRCRRECLFPAVDCWSGENESREELTPGLFIISGWHSLQFSHYSTTIASQGGCCPGPTASLPHQASGDPDLLTGRCAPVQGNNVGDLLGSGAAAAAATERSQKGPSSVIECWEDILLRQLKTAADERPLVSNEGHLLTAPYHISLIPPAARERVTLGRCGVLGGPKTLSFL